jgi:hypothetical protein
MDDRTDFEFLRHTVATVVYRVAKAVRNVPEGFSTFRAGSTSRTAGQILAHIGDLFYWALWLAKGQHVWHDSTPQSWADEIRRFFESVRQFDAYLATGQPLKCSPEKLFQGPVADALTHVGQIAMLRRLAGAPVRGENYYKAEIVVGRVGIVQSTARVEFD